MDVSVVIVNYNGGEWIIRSIRAVLDTTREMECEILVADNASTDDSDRQVESIFDSQVRLLRLEANQGYAAANNAALPYCSGRNILFLNPDTEVQLDAIKMLCTYLDTHAEVGACGGNLFTPKGTPAFSYWMLLPGVRFEVNRLFSDMFLHLRHRGSEEHNHTDRTKEVAHIMGADLMVKRSVLNQVGAMDDAFFLFYEDTELCCRIARAGYRLVNIPDAHIIHAEGQSIDVEDKRMPYMMASRRIYLQKCVSVFEHRIADAVLWLNCSIRLFWFTLAHNEKKQSYWSYIQTHIKA